MPWVVQLSNGWDICCNKNRTIRNKQFFVVNEKRNIQADIFEQVKLQRKNACLSAAQKKLKFKSESQQSLEMRQKVSCWVCGFQVLHAKSKDHSSFMWHFFLMKTFCRLSKSFAIRFFCLSERLYKRIQHTVPWKLRWHHVH